MKECRVVWVVQLDQHAVCVVRQWLQSGRLAGRPIQVESSYPQHGQPAACFRAFPETVRSTRG